MWTKFWDMCSGGGHKESYGHIYIEALIEEAEVIFYNRFGHNPRRVSCTCCGPDYSISEDETLEQITGYDRGCAFVYFRPDGTECPENEGWERGVGTREGYSSGYVERQGNGVMTGNYIDLEGYIALENVLVIWASEIEEEERVGHVPEQGYVWRD